MKKAVLILAALTACCSLFAQKTDALKIKSYTLDNGMSVWINEDHSSPKAYGAVVVKAGARDCAGTGIAHYFEHMMFKGTSRFGTVDYEAEKPYLDSIAVLYDKLAQTRDEAERTAIQVEINKQNIAACQYAIPNEFDALTTETGSSNLNAFTSYDETVYHSDFIPAYFEQWARINADRISDPVFRLFQSELETVYEEKNMYDDEVMNSLFEKLMSEFFKGTPYEISVIGTTENLKNPQLNMMAGFFNDYYVANNMTLVLSGDLNADEIMPVIEKTFGTIRSGAPVVHPEVNPAPFNGEQRLEILADIPLIKLSARCYRLPALSDPDNIKLEILSNLMNNAEGTGLLDKLGVENKLMEAGFMTQGLNGAGMGILLVIPKLVGQSSEAAEKIVDAVLDDVKAGNIDEAFFRSCLLSYKKYNLTSIEDLEKRVYAMASVASMGRDWDEYLNEIESVDRFTLEDIAETARKYLGDDYLHAFKKTGKPEKEHLNKPPYEKVVPAGKDSVSAYARELRKSAEGIVPAIRDVDFASSSDVRVLSDNVTLYANTNPLNDVFNLEYRFETGSIDNPALDRLQSYLSVLGTEDRSYDEFYGRLQELGGGLSFGDDLDNFTVEISGFDDNFEETVALASEILYKVKGDRKKLASTRSAEKSSKAMNRKDLQSVAAALFYKVAYGEASPELVDKGDFSDKVLMDVYDKVTSSTCNILYSGSASADEVSAVLAKCFDASAVTNRIEVPSERTVLDYDSSAVYFIDSPSASQAMIFGFVPLDRLPDLDTRSMAKLYNSYLGGGMTSVMFQEIREFRSMAYSTGSQLAIPSWVNRNDRIAYLIPHVGTQCDKAIEAMEVVDSLIHKTPMREGKLAGKIKETLNDASNGYPDFRGMGGYIATLKLDGYESDVRSRNAGFVEGVTIGDLEAFHQKYVADAPIIWCVVGSAARIGTDGFSKFGPVTVLKVSDVMK